MKVEIGAKNCLYPLPTTLVGALVNDKPNYITIAHVGIMDLGSISLGMGKAHYTNAGIRANGTFSVNIASVKMVKETDYCGLVSGKTQDKSGVFKTFFGKLKTAPMTSALGRVAESHFLQKLFCPVCSRALRLPICASAITNALPATTGV